jgi:hypothetical protein
MSRGPILTEAEIERARKLYGAGLSWRGIGNVLNRDHAGLRRRVLKLMAPGRRTKPAPKNVVLDGVLKELSARHRALAAE